MSKYVFILEKKAIGMLFLLKTKKITLVQANFECLLSEIGKHDEAICDELGARYQGVLETLRREK